MVRHRLASGSGPVGLRFHPWSIAGAASNALGSFAWAVDGVLVARTLARHYIRGWESDGDG